MTGLLVLVALSAEPTGASTPTSPMDQVLLGVRTMQVGSELIRDGGRSDGLTVLQAGLALARSGLETSRPSPPSVEAGCEAIHPSQFTNVDELRSDDPAEPAPIPLYHADAGPSHCGNGSQAGRFTISERAEIVVSFDYAAVQNRTPHLGRVDVSGQIISGPSVRPIEIPGYREIGTPLADARKQASEDEEVVAGVAQLAQVSRDLGSCFQTRASTPGAAYAFQFEPGLMGIAGGTSCEGPWHGAWVFLGLFEHADSYQKSFDTILGHAGAFASTPPYKGEPGADVLESMLQISRLGQEVLSARQTALSAIAVRLAHAEGDLVRDQLAKRQVEYTSRGSCVTVPLRVACDASEVTEFCNRLEEMCGSSKPADLVRLNEDSRRIPAVIEHWIGTRVAQLKLLTPNDLYGDLIRFARASEAHAKAYPTWVDAHPAPLEEIAGLMEFPPLRAMSTEMDGLRLKLDSAWQRALEIARVQPGVGTDRMVSEARSALESAAAGTLRERLKRLRGHSWKSTRFQPRVLGVKGGDIIELTISYIAADPAPTVTPPVPGATTNGNSARWVLRFLVNRNGLYVLAGPRISLAWSHEYAPKAATFRGSNGSLVPGVTVDVAWFVGENWNVFARIVGFLVAGAGLHLDYLDFDSAQSVEIGLGVHLSLLRGVVAFGVGYNFGIPDVRLSGREVYWSIGLGIEQLFDQARRLADEYTR